MMPLRHCLTLTLGALKRNHLQTVLAIVGMGVGVGALVAIPHLLIDDGHLVRIWLRDVKHAREPALSLWIAVDQTFHVLCLLGAALAAA